MVEQYQIKWSKKALNDLISLYRFIRDERQEPMNAEKVKIALLKQVASLKIFPEKYATDRYLVTHEKRYRSAVVKSSFKVGYRIVEEEVRIVHTKRSRSL